MQVFIIDDEPEISRSMEKIIAPFKLHTACFSNTGAVLSQLKENPPDLVFLDYRLGSESGLALIPNILQENPSAYIVMMTAFASFEVALEAMKLGAKDFLKKPFSLEEVEIIVKRFIELSTLKDRLKDLEEEYGTDQILLESRNPKVKELLKLAKKAAESQSVVLITGESGSGKTELAKAIHQWSYRHQFPFATVACPTLGTELLESELFGHVKGAFTGAVANHQGRIAKCEGGTLFLDEIGTLPLSLQPKLLRFLQDFSYERVGDTTTHQADVRIIAATNADLASLVRQGVFREDLFYRLNVIELHLPPLRERPEDIEALSQIILLKLCKKHGRAAIRLTQNELKSLSQHPWRGNIRELHNTLERALIFSNEGEPLQIHFQHSLLPTQSVPTIQVGGPHTLEEVEKAHIEATLARLDSIEEVSQALGINPSTLWRKRKTYEEQARAVFPAADSKVGTPPSDSGTMH